MVDVDVVEPHRGVADEDLTLPGLSRGLLRPLEDLGAAVSADDDRAIHIVLSPYSLFLCLSLATRRPW